MVKYLHPSYNIITKIDNGIEFLGDLVNAGRKCYQSESVLINAYRKAKNEKDVIIEDEQINKAKEIIDEFYNIFGRDYYKNIQSKESIDYDLFVRHADIIKFIKERFKIAHMSIMEHVFISVEFICCRGFTHELVRHRIMSFSQESTRYCNYSQDKYGKEISVIIPRDFDQWDEKIKVQWKMAMEYAEKKYFELLSLGVKPQIARGVLPIDLKTSITATANVREWFDVVMYLRADKPAHPSMQQLMYPLFDELRSKIPILFDYQKKITYDLMKITKEDREKWKSWIK